VDADLDEPLVSRCYSAGQAEVNEIQCRLGAVSGVECRPGCRDMPLYAAICRSLERKLLIFLGLGFSFASSLWPRSASRAKLAREPEGRGLRATLRVAKPSQPKAARESLPARHLYRCGSRIRQVSEANRRIPPGAPVFSGGYELLQVRFHFEGPYRAVWGRQIQQTTGRFLRFSLRARRREVPAPDRSGPTDLQPNG
jgi:uncharacterized protein (DUF58 family)